MAPSPSIQSIHPSEPCLLKGKSVRLSSYKSVYLAGVRYLGTIVTLAGCSCLLGSCWPGLVQSRLAVSLRPLSFLYYWHHHHHRSFIHSFIFSPYLVPNLTSSRQSPLSPPLCSHSLLSSFHSLAHILSFRESSSLHQSSYSSSIVCPSKPAPTTSLSNPFSPSSIGLAAL